MSQPNEIVIYDPFTYALTHGEGGLVFIAVILWGVLFALFLSIMPRPPVLRVDGVAYTVAGALAAACVYGLYRYLF